METRLINIYKIIEEINFLLHQEYVLKSMLEVNFVASISFERWIAGSNREILICECMEKEEDRSLKLFEFLTCSKIQYHF